jgi:hypothetical protein
MAAAVAAKSPADGEKGNSASNVYSVFGTCAYEGHNEMLHEGLRWNRVTGGGELIIKAGDKVKWEGSKRSGAAGEGVVIASVRTDCSTRRKKEFKWRLLIRTIVKGSNKSVDRLIDAASIVTDPKAITKGDMTDWMTAAIAWVTPSHRARAQKTTDQSGNPALTAAKKSAVAKPAKKLKQQPNVISSIA